MEHATYGDWPCSSSPPFPGEKRNDDNDNKRVTAREIVSVIQELTNKTDKLKRDLKDYVYNCPCCRKSLTNIDKYIEEHSKQNGPGHGHGNGANPPTRTDLRLPFPGEKRNNDMIKKQQENNSKRNFKQNRPTEKRLK